MNIGLPEEANWPNPLRANFFLSTKGIEPLSSNFFHEISVSGAF
jgi:hypothetical protein